MVEAEKIAVVTGSAGFIGFSLAEKLLKNGFTVIGIDNFNTYYDVELKIQRNKILTKYEQFFNYEFDITDSKKLNQLFDRYRPNFVFHLAAQAGVRYSISNPDQYIDSNLVGTFQLLEVTKLYKPAHILFASTSSVYGAGVDFPYSEKSKADHQISLYAATKKACEALAHSYSHLYKIPITSFRFFTVYGPWGRPDMALFKFTKAIIEKSPVEVYNNGKMSRDFTFIDDITEALLLLHDKIPNKSIGASDSISPVAPYRVINIGNSKPVDLVEFIDTLEHVLNKRANKIYLPMQLGDVKDTWADSSLLFQLTKFEPSTPLIDGISKFCKWYLEHYSK